LARPLSLAHPPPQSKRKQNKQGNAYRQILARTASGAVKFSSDLGMSLPQPWDLVNLTTVLEDNLAPTLKLWRTVAPRRPTVRDIFRLALNSSYHGQSDTRRVAVIRDGRVTFPLMPDGPQQSGCAPSTCNPQLIAWLDGMRRAVHVYGLKLPDVVVSLNVQDGGGPCAQGQIEDRVPACAAPSLVVSKLDVGSDVAAPMLLLPDANATLRHAPWAAKRARAFFRGVPSCGDMQFVQRGACARTWFARLAQLRPDALDAGECRRDEGGLTTESSGCALVLKHSQPPIHHRNNTTRAGLVEPHCQTAEEVAAQPGAARQRRPAARAATRAAPRAALAQGVFSCE
jgi:hypothetical protein